MFRERTLYIVLILLFISYVVVDYYSPKPLDWTVTFSDKQKTPFACYVLVNQLDNLFPNGASVEYLTFYESVDSLHQQIVLSESFEPDEQDIDVLLEAIQTGGSYLIGASFFSKKFLDTLDVEQQYDMSLIRGVSKDSSAIVFDNESYYYPISMLNSSFNVSSMEDIETLASLEGKPILIQKSIGEGNLILCSTPLIFTNYGLLHKDNYRLVEKVLSRMPDSPTTFNRYFHVGKPEATTPLRYVLKQESLSWALYMGLFAIVLLFIFGTRRKQKVIDIISPPENSTIHFTKTVGGLYHRQFNHKNAAEKVIQHFYKLLGENYHIHEFTETSYQHIADRTGRSLEDVIKTFEDIQRIKSASSINESTLEQLYWGIRKFKLNEI